MSRHPAPCVGPAALRCGGVSRRRAMALTAALGAAAAAPREGLGQTAAPSGAAARAGGTLHVAMRVPPIRDPRLFDWMEMGNIARQVVEPLVRLTPDGALEPWLLAGWRMDPDARRVRLFLREGVRWSNGDAFTAADVVTNLRRWCDSTVPGNSMAERCRALIDPETGQLGAGALEVVDERTVDLRLRMPDVTLIAGFADYPALVVHRAFDAAGGDIAAAPVGTGPFRLVAVEPGLRARVERAERWWGGPVALEAVEWHDLGPSPVVQAQAFEAGAVHLNMQTPATALDRFDALGLRRHARQSANTVVARMHVATPPYDDPAVRRAIQRAVDNGVVLAIGYAGHGIRGENTHVGPMHPDGAAVPAHPSDPAEARRQIAALRLTGYPFELLSVDDDWRRDTADAIGVQLLDAGFNLQRRLLAPAEFWQDWQRYPFSVTDWGMRPFGVQTLALAYRSGAAWNETGFADPIFDAALDTALGIADPARRKGVMALLQTRLRDSGAIIQPYWREVFAHSAPALRGFRLHPTFEQHFEAVWLQREN